MEAIVPWALNRSVAILSYVAGGNRAPTCDFNKSNCEWYSRVHLIADPTLAQLVREAGDLLGDPITRWVLEQVEQIRAYVDHGQALPHNINEAHCEWLARVHLAMRPDLAQLALTAAAMIRFSQQN